MLAYSEKPVGTAPPKFADRDQNSKTGFSYRLALSLIGHLRWTISVLAIIGALLGCLITKMIPPRYVATAQIYLDPRSLPGADKEDALVRQVPTGFINYVETQARILSSQVVLERVVDAQKLGEDSEFDGRSGFSSQIWPSPTKNPTDVEARANAIRILGSRISVRRPERTFIIEISATSADPEKAARIANAVTQAYTDVQTSMQSQSAQQAAETFSARLGGLGRELIGSEHQVEDFKAKNGFIGTKDYLDDQTLNDLNRQLTIARARLEDTRSRYGQVKAAQNDSSQISVVAATLDIPTLTNLRAAQTDVLQKLADLSAELGPRHPAVLNAKARVNEIQRLVLAELDRIAGSFRMEFERATVAEDGLKRRVDELRQRSLASAQASVKLRELERQVDANRTIYESFLTRARQTAESQQLDSASTHIVTTAQTPTTRSFPPSTILTAALGMLAGAGLGALIALWPVRVLLFDPAADVVSRSPEAVAIEARSTRRTTRPAT